jgi:probable rRNA maturation factor
MSIDFVYNTDFELSNKEQVSDWVLRVINSKGYKLGNLVYAFFNDEDLKDLNIRFLKHDYYTDVISFDETADQVVSGNIAISVDRVKENSTQIGVDFEEEMHRVMIHGVLHFVGFNDKTSSEKKEIREQEALALSMFHVKQ